MPDKINSPAMRQILFAFVAAIGAAIVLFAIWYFVIRTPYVEAFSNLKSTDASIIVQELEKNKVPYKLADQGQSILVPEDQVDATRVSILGGDLPLKGIVGFELFNESDMGLTEFAQRINYQRALQGELARTLMSFSNIESARVHLSLPESGIFDRQKRTAKASATLQAKIGMDIDAETVSAVQRLIVSAVPDLEVSNVAVLDANGQLLTSAQDPAGGNFDDGFLPSPEEQDLIDRATNALAPIFNDDQLRVVVQVTEDQKPAASDTSSSGVEQGDTPPDAGIDTPAGDAAYRLDIKVGSSQPATAAERAEAISALQQSIGFDPDRGDRLMIIPIGQPPVSAQAGTYDKANQAAENLSPQDEPASTFQIPNGIYWAIGILLIVMLSLFVIGRFRNPKTLTLDKRLNFSSQLQQLLADQQRDKDGVAR
ncbi:flagellar basal-body MS-ring/collar protein FliF [Sphingorhabdus arenilitoris]|uniref:Flagellar basal-body MS-ring/collar protein FliF n=1 Tax=Sphingorhabdus arenilitoris TaxID=1490041 RepID=A0ABV8RCL6_9SPHN